MGFFGGFTTDEKEEISCIAARQHKLCLEYIESRLKTHTDIYHSKFAQEHIDNMPSRLRKVEAIVSSSAPQSDLYVLKEQVRYLETQVETLMRIIRKKG